MNQNSDVFIVVGHGLYEPWLNIYSEGQKKTWLSNSSSNGTEVIHIHGTPLGKIGWKFDRLHEKLRWTNRWVSLILRIFDRVIGIPFIFFIPNIRISKLFDSTQAALQVHFPDSYQFMRWKDLAMLKYFINERSENYIFSTTTSSYLIPSRLKSIISSLPRVGLYAGVKAYEGANFAAGNNRLISRDVAKMILDKRVHFDCGLIEDAALGKLVKKLGIPFRELPSLNITSVGQLETIPDSIFDTHFHIRVKSGTFSERNDVEIMKQVHIRIMNMDLLS
jgi:hypothetical protein